MSTSFDTLPKEPEISLEQGVGGATGQNAESEQVEENLVANENILLASTKSRCAQSIFRDELSSSTGSFIQDALAEAESFKSEIEQSAVAREFVAKLQELGAEFPSWELRIVNGSYDVIKHSMPDISGENDRNYSNNPSGDVESPRHKNATKVSTPTVANSGAISKLFERLYYCTRTGKWPKPVTQRISVLSDINLNLRSGKMYLVLGAPGSGKSSLLKYISHMLQEDKDHIVGGSLLLNGVSPIDREFEWRNLVTYVDQLDQHHEYLTVRETLQYAFDCLRGTHKSPYIPHNSTNDAIIAEMDKNHFAVNIVLEALGLKRVKDTYVGNDVSVRGVSGGERKRVTLGELLSVGAPVFCCDEISTGLDAATTFDICKGFAFANAVSKQIRVVALLAPPPETVALFDELIVIDEGKIIYSGPTNESLPYFEALVNQHMPARADPGEWLLSLLGNARDEQYAQQFQSSEKGGMIQVTNTSRFSDSTSKILDDPRFTKRYHTYWFKNLRLVVAHEFLLWKRDRIRVRARLIQLTVMGLVIGTVFYKQGDNPYSGIGVLFQTLMFLSLGTLVFVLTQVDNRAIVYKHQDLNFYPTWIFVLGRFLALIPAVTLDIIFYGTVVFFLSGMAYDDGASFWNFLIFLLLLFLNAIATVTLFSVYSAISKDRTTAISVMTLSILLMILFSGFTVQPLVIPSYWVWAYWINPFAWSLRGLLINQYGSGKFGEEGNVILQQLGFINSNGEAHQFIWVWWAALFTCSVSFIAISANAILLNKIRFRTVSSTKQLIPDNSTEEPSDDDVDFPFQVANLTFTGISYSVMSSDGKETIELLKGVDGYFEAGKMTALMGSSGAGKTTLMDVLALRKTGGEICGEVRLNGHLQEATSFRRCTGYVEQFDVQSAQLTVKETIMFSAKMRLDRSDPIVTDTSILKFVHKTMKMLDLLSIQDSVVGSGVGNGLSFEQKKRLSIAVEVASNPSVLFLDEPTSGLDASAAAVVIQGLKRIAASGRAVCATIHQPSVAVFNSFDNLLLLKRGGEAVFFGELGHESANLIEYFENFEATPKIRINENPATWMLNVIGGGAYVSRNTDYVLAYSDSRLHQQCLDRIADICFQKSERNEINFPTKYATGFSYQVKHVYSRMSLVYWRSPSYNRTRLIVGALIALLFGSVYASQRVIQNEVQLNSICNSMYISVLFLGVNAGSTGVTFFEKERNMFYRHKAALMYDQLSLTLASLLSEAPFILMVGMIFSVCFYFPLGFEAVASKFFLFYYFVTATVGLFTFLGQMLISVFRDAVTAQGFSAVFIGMSSLFAGTLIAPQNIPQVWIWAYWVFPLHYVVEGLLMSQFTGSDLQIEATSESSWYVALQCTESPCYGSPSEFLEWRFGGFFDPGHIPWNALYLILVIVTFKCIKMVALQKLNYLSK